MITRNIRPQGVLGVGSGVEPQEDPLITRVREIIVKAGFDGNHFSIEKKVIYGHLQIALTGDFHSSDMHKFRTAIRNLEAANIHVHAPTFVIDERVQVGMLPGEDARFFA